MSAMTSLKRTLGDESVTFSHIFNAVSLPINIANSSHEQCLISGTLFVVTISINMVSSGL